MLNDQTNWKSFSCEKLNENYCSLAKFCENSCFIFLPSFFFPFCLFVCCVLIAGEQKAHIKYRTFWQQKKKHNVYKSHELIQYFGREK